MGCPKSRATENHEASPYEACKRRRMSPPNECEDSPRLIPSLPDELSVQIIARLPKICYLNAKRVSRKWRSTITSPELYKLRKELGTSEEWLYLLTKLEEEKLVWNALDPETKRWQRLPPMPEVPCEEEAEPGRVAFPVMWVRSVLGPSMRIADFIRGWLGHRSSFDRMPFCGCAVGAVGGSLYVLGGFSRASAVKSVWRYDPVANAWSESPAMSTGRAYGKTGVLNEKLYVVGGVSQGRAGLAPLQSAEVFDPEAGSWAPLPSMPFSKAQVLPTAFLADMLKPIATGLTSYMGRLCVPQSLYSWPFFVDVGGEIYDPEADSWAEMPTGMGEGWPARQAGTKLSVVVDGELYAFDPSSSLDSGKIKVYDQREDAWKVVIGKVPIYDFAGSESPYLLAGFHGKLHVITRDVDHDISILRADLQDKAQAAPSGSSDSLPESDAVIWKVIAKKDFGSAELVSCQVLDV